MVRHLSQLKSYYEIIEMYTNSILIQFDVYIVIMKMMLVVTVHSKLKV